MCLDRGQSRKCQFLPTWDPCIHSTAVQSDTGLLVEHYAAVVLDTYLESAKPTTSVHESVVFTDRVVRPLQILRLPT
jgi:hypothetical protein